LPRSDPWREQLDDGLPLPNAGKSTPEQLTLIRMFEELRALGYECSYDAVRRYVKSQAFEAERRQLVQISGLHATQASVSN
jgi:hypothetical protein